MKKQILILMALMIATTVQIHCQVQRSFFGCTLGESSLIDAEVALSMRGYKYYYDTEEIDDNIVIRHIEHAGVVFDKVTFLFEDLEGKMNEALFVKQYGSFSSASAAQEKLVRVIKAGCDIAYEKVFIKDLPTFWFSDDDVTCSIGLLKHFPNGYTLAVMYEYDERYKQY